MSHAVLFSQCMQRDFVAHVSEHVALPNRLHVGRREAVRLLGRDPTRGPMAQIMRWARAQAVDELTIVHVRDWHDPVGHDPVGHDPVGHERDPQVDRQHFERFGPHCVANTPGAQLVLGLDAEVASRPNEHYVNASGLNDFHGTNLAALVARAQAAADGDLRVGVIGVWTEAKVSYLLYELATRCGLSQLATCSALTASASRTQHFNALGQLERLLGVRVEHSVGDFANWLLPTGKTLAAAVPAPSSRPKIQIASGSALTARDVAPLGHVDADVVAVLYSDAASVVLTPLAGGFSGARVFRVAGQDLHGHQIAPTVLKLGPRDLIAQERVAFEKVEAVLGNDAPTLRAFADIGARAGIMYAYAAMGGTGVCTFQAQYNEGMPPARVAVVLEQVFGGILARLTSAAQYERLSLLDAYTFDSTYAADVQAQVESIVGGPVGERIEVLPGQSCMNPALFYRDVLPNLGRYGSAFHYVSFVHGDMNAANLLLDGRDNAWVIDFAHTGRSHVLTDVAKFENDLQYILTPITNEAELSAAMALTRGLVGLDDLAAPLPAAIRGVDQPVVRRCLGTLRALRKHTALLCREDRNPTHLALPLLRYAVHTLSFEESTHLQKRWALYAAGLWANYIADDHARNQVLRIDWIDDPCLGDDARLGITICPGRADRGRSLDEDIAALVAQGVGHLVCLLPSAELERVGVAHLAAAARAAGITFAQAPIQDQQAAPLARVAEVVDRIDEALRGGACVAVHCMGGLGRSGMVAAGVLTRRGRTHVQGIASIRRARGPRAVETVEQERLVRDLARQALASAQ